MRHLKRGRRLGRTSSHRWAMLRNMVTSLIQHERIETTVPKAKELRPLAEQMVTLAKRKSLHSLRQAESVIRDPENLHKLFDELGERYKERNGGYTRILRTRRRKGDNAPMAFIEYIDRPGELRKARPPMPAKMHVLGAEDDDSPAEATPPN